jgi:hypothetical protein
MPKWVIMLIDPEDGFAQGYVRTLFHFLLYGIVVGAVVTGVICLMQE